MNTINEKQLELLPHLSQVAFALFCAKQVQHLSINIPEAVIAIKTVEKYLIGKATKEECKAAAYNAAATATYNTAAAAAYAAAAATAANAAADAYAAAAATAAGNTKEENKAKIIKEQNEYYDNLLAMVDGRIDKMLVGMKPL